MKITRRKFLFLASTSAAGIALSDPVGKVLGQSDSLIYTQQEWIPGVEKWVKSICLQCPGGCGIQVKVLEGRAVKIEGNPLHPINQGGLCPKGQSSLQVLYDPDRIKQPFKQTKERGTEGWQPISWDDAIAEVAEKLKTLRGQNEPHTLAVMSGRSQGHMQTLMQRFLSAYGSPNEITHSSISSDSAKKANYFTQGVDDYLGYDLENTNYLLCFGTSLLEAGRATLHRIRAYGQMRRGRPGTRAKIVVIDPRFSISASKVDEWIPIRLGTDGALALGIAHVIVREGNYDSAFVDEHTFGFEDWQDIEGINHIGFSTMVLGDYSPETVAEITGVPADTIVRIAEEFASNRPALAIGGRGLCMHSNGIYNQMAVHSLNALMGNIDAPGGVLTQRQPPFKAWSSVIMDNIAKKGVTMPRADKAGSAEFPFATSVYQQFPKSILQQLPYKINALFLYYTNPLFSVPQNSEFVKVFKDKGRLPFIVSFSPFMDESTQYADLILPDHTFLERWQDDIIEPSLGFPVFGIRQPVVEPLYDTRNTGDVIIQIAKKLGGPVAESFKWADFQEALKESIRGVYDSKVGSTVEDTFDKFWEKLLEQGAWWNPPYPFGKWTEVFPHPVGRFAFYSNTMKKTFEKIAQEEAQKKGTASDIELEKLLSNLKINVRGDNVYMPHYEPPREVGDENEYPFRLNVYKTMTQAEGRGANQPFLQEIYGLHVNEKWSNWVEINPEEAEELGIEDEDWVFLESPVGQRIKVRAKLYPGTMHGVVNMPHGQGHKAYGRWAKDRGENPNLIIANEYDSLTGAAAWSATRVRIKKAGEPA